MKWHSFIPVSQIQPEKCVTPPPEEPYTIIHESEVVAATNTNNSSQTDNSTSQPPLEITNTDDSHLAEGSTKDGPLVDANTNNSARLGFGIILDILTHYSRHYSRSIFQKSVRHLSDNCRFCSENLKKVL